jgi:hypothetical protein
MPPRPAEIDVALIDDVANAGRRGRDETREER